MFAVEIASGIGSELVSLLADAIDFFGDAANFAISVAVLTMTATVRSRASIFEAACMALFGVFVLARAILALQSGSVPEPVTMGVVAIAALAANVGVVLLLYRYREGDANTRSVWICSRNDGIGNVAVGMAAVGEFGTAAFGPT